MTDAIPPSGLSSMPGSTGAYPPGIPYALPPVTPPPKKGMNGCLKGCLIFFATVILLTCVGTGMLWYFRREILAWTVEKGSDAIITAVADVAGLSTSEVNEVAALKKVVLDGIRLDRFQRAHLQKMGEAMARLNRRIDKDGRPTRKDVIDVVDEVEEVCRDVGCDMTEVDRYRARRAAPASSPAEESGSPDSGMSPGTSSPGDGGDDEEGDGH